MSSRVSTTYKLRTVADELLERQKPDPLLHNRPHIRAALASPAGRFLIRHLQNFCWTCERLLHPASSGTQAAPIVREGAPAGEGAPRLFLDMTNTVRNRQNTGIQRVCRRLAAESFDTGLFVPTIILDGELHALRAMDRAYRVEPSAADVFAILDTFWDPIGEYIPLLTRLRAQGVVTAACFYDVVPSLHPEICEDRFVATFTRDLLAINELVDIRFAISQTTVEDLRCVLERAGVADANDAAIFHFHLGADFGTAAASPRADTRAPGTAFLSVGTIEPKKGYAVTLDAFDRLWAEGVDASLTMVGKLGWGVEHIRDRIETHPQLGRHLHWLRSASDNALAAAYANADYFIQASVAEGFGIPIFEAAKAGLPVIASDIDVFREIGGDGLFYFRSESADDLAAVIRRVLHERPVLQPLPTLSWRDSLAQLYAGLTAAHAKVREARQPHEEAAGEIVAR